MATPIAHWDIVPFRSFNTPLNVGVLATHHLGIAKVQFWYTQSANYQQVFNGPPQQEVTSTQVNPQNVDNRGWGFVQNIPHVPVKEYFITLDPNAPGVQPGVPFRVKAIAIPNGSCPSKIVLSPPLTGRTLPAEVAESLDHVAFTPSPPSRLVYYGDQNAPASNSACSSLNPCQTIAKIFDRLTTDVSAAVQQGQTRASFVDRVEIRLGPSVNGDWTLEGVNTSALSTDAQMQWLTFRPAVGVSPSQVRVRGCNEGWSVSLTAFNNVTMTGKLCSSRNNLGASQYSQFDRRYAWFHQVGVVGEGLITIARGSYGVDAWSLGNADFIGTYLTESYTDYMTSAARGYTLVQHVFANRTGDGHFTGTNTVVNGTLRTAYGSNYPYWQLDPSLASLSPLDYHGDYYQLWDIREDVMIYGARYDQGGFLSLRGIAGTSPAIHRNVAVMESVLDLHVASNPQTQAVWDMCASPGDGISSGTILDHIVVENSTLVGSTNYCQSNPSLFYQPNFRNVGYHNSAFRGFDEPASAPSLPPSWNNPSVTIWPCPPGGLYCQP